MADSILKDRAETYCSQRNILLVTQLLGEGKDGSVWPTSRLSALKIHGQIPSYVREMEAYRRLRDVGLKNVGGHNVPYLIDSDDELCAIEMTIVTKPFIVDFASAYLDDPPDLIEDDGHTFEDFIRERFDDRAPEVMTLYNELIARAGIYLTDLHPDNVKF